MTSNNNFERYVDYMIEVFNGLRYDEDGEVVKSASRTVPIDEEFFGKFDEIKWEIAEWIGYDICSIYEESDNCVIYEIVGYDYDMEYIKIKLGEKSDAFVAFYSSLEQME